MIELTTTEISRLAFKKLVLDKHKDAALELAEQLLNKDMITLGYDEHSRTISKAIIQVVGNDIQDISIYDPVNDAWFIVVSGFYRILVEKQHYEEIKMELNK
ncbi:MAG: hypothetical protein H6Q15_2170 [Bacteroidetes bacterium]|nr:hypothetical protein [Bacteroidota bacterium]